MAAKTDLQLTTQVGVITNETTVAANTASRVGGTLKDMVDSKLNIDAVAALLSPYLTANAIGATYLTQVLASTTYLSQVAATAYLTQSAAAAAYLTQASAASTYEPIIPAKTYGTIAAASSSPYITLTFDFNAVTTAGMFRRVLLPLSAPIGKSIFVFAQNNANEFDVRANIADGFLIATEGVATLVSSVTVLPNESYEFISLGGGIWKSQKISSSTFLTSALAASTYQPISRTYGNIDSDNVSPFQPLDSDINAVNTTGATDKVLLPLGVPTGKSIFVFALNNANSFAVRANLAAGNLISTGGISNKVSSVTIAPNESYEFISLPAGTWKAVLL